MNPGGVPRQALELRRLALERAREWIERLDELTKSKDHRAAVMACQTGLGRALGREVAPSELPEDIPLPPAGETSPARQLQTALELLERDLSYLKARMEAGVVLSENERAALRNNAQILATLAKEDRELAKAGPAAQLSDDKLSAEVLAGMPLEAIRAEVERRLRAAPETESAK